MGTRIVVRCLIGAGMALALWLAGCGTMPGVSSVTNPGQNAVEKCQNLGYANDDIDLTYSLVESERQSGVSSSQVLRGFSLACEDEAECLICVAAIVDEVYGL